MSNSDSEKSNLMQTCKLLSQYFNGKASLKDLINNKEEALATKDLLTNMEELSTKTTKQDQKLIDLVPKSLTINSFNEMEVSINKATSSKEIPNKEQKLGQMCIFYGGNIVVFDDFTAEKARAVMLLASKGISHNSFQTITMDNTAPQTNEANNFDLPIARRSSLYRFLEKRKDRDMTRAPYQMNNPLASSSRTHEDHFDLNV